MSPADLSSELARAAKVQEALYRIAELASAARDMQEFYAAIHGIVGELMYAKNFFIALYDDERRLTNWPYFVDERDLADVLPDPNQWLPFDRSRSVTGYVLRTGEPQHLSGEQMTELNGRGEIELLGELSEDWLGVPLKADQQTVGVLAVQSYEQGVRYTQEDEELLAFVGQHVGTALSRARAIEETRQRNAELALINSVQEAIAGELDQQAIYDVVGDRIQEIFDAQAVSIATLDEATGTVLTPYMIERGERLLEKPQPPSGFTRHVLETCEPTLVAESMEAEAERYGSTVTAGEMSKSGLWVPLLSGGRATGVISLQNVDREHAFAESDRQLLETLAGSLSVALENARLVHETQAEERGAGLDQQRAGRDRGRARPAGDLRRRSATRSRRSSTPRSSRSTIARRNDGSRGLAVHHRTGRAPAGRSASAARVREARSGDTGVSADRREHRRRGPSGTGAQSSVGERPKSGPVRPARDRRQGRRARSRSRTSTASTRSASRTSSCWRRWRAA